MKRWIALGLVILTAALTLTGCEIIKNHSDKDPASAEIMEMDVARTYVPFEEQFEVVYVDLQEETDEEPAEDPTEATEIARPEEPEYFEETEYSDQENFEETAEPAEMERYVYSDIAWNSGTLVIPDAGIDVLVYYSENGSFLQEIVDRWDSAVMYMGNVEYSPCIIADHNRQGFEGLVNVTEGSEAYVSNADGTTTYLKCVAAFRGHNTETGYPYDITDLDFNPVWGSADVIMYTCMEDCYNIRVTLWNRQ